MASEMTKAATARKADNYSTPTDRGPRFAPGNPGRRAGSKNKVVNTLRLQAHEAFEPLWELAKQRIKAHLSIHSVKGKDKSGAALDCATCRHHITLIAEYVFGKPTQPVEFDMRSAAQFLAEKTGRPVEEIMRSASELAEELRQRGWSVVA